MNALRNTLYITRLRYINWTELGRASRNKRSDGCLGVALFKTAGCCWMLLDITHTPQSLVSLLTHLTVLYPILFTFHYHAIIPQRGVLRERNCRVIGEQTAAQKIIIFLEGVELLPLVCTGFLHWPDVHWWNWPNILVRNYWEWFWVVSHVARHDVLPFPSTLLGNSSGNEGLWEKLFPRWVRSLLLSTLWRWQA